LSSHFLIEEHTADRALKELFYALLATGITVLFSIAFYIAIPSLVGTMRHRDAALVHPKTFKATPAGGEIEYLISPDFQGNKEDQMKLYREDLEILSARFSRGHFEMATLPGMAESRVVKNLLPFKDQMEFKLQPGNAAVLSIVCKNPAAVAPLHEYLQHLEKYWK